MKGVPLLKQTNCKLRDLSRRHLKRVLLSIAIAVPLIAFGGWLLQYEVSQQGIQQQVAPVINWPLITMLAFVFNLWLPWKDRQPDKKQALKRWVLMSLGHSCISY